MSSKTLCRLLRLSVMVVGLIGVGMMLYVPSFVHDFVRLGGLREPFAGFDWEEIWSFSVWLCGAPLFAILFYVWRVAGSVARDEVFTLRTAKWVKMGGLIMLADGAFVLVTNVLLFGLEYSALPILAASLLLTIVAVVLGLFAAVLARYLTKAAALQEDVEGTI
ncbi:MAG: DUF2975 domain-containing protein [Oscillospiraceae bacterium]|jgi:hypothetical protein|nr:DUF2975 domain-containing protein [Oscillospiraceae bacterium]